MDAAVIPFAELDLSEHSHEFIGGDHGDVPFSVILVHGAGRRTGGPSASVP